MAIEHKITRGLIKAMPAKDGEPFVATHVVSVFDNKDHVGDVVRPGAFSAAVDNIKQRIANGNPMMSFYSHRMDDPTMCVGKVIDLGEALPGDPRLIGAGTLAEKNGGLVAQIQYDDDPVSQKVVSMIKDGRLTQSSFTYEVQDGGLINGKSDDDSGLGQHYEIRKVDLLELGPCALGCNDQTTVVGVKERHAAARVADKAALPVSVGPTTCEDKAWDGPKTQAAIPADAKAIELAAFYAWKDSSGDPDAKATYRFIHHDIVEGKAGPANLKACQTGIGVLNGGRGGTTIPDADVQGVYDHLAAHIKEAGEAAPALGKSLKAMGDATGVQDCPSCNTGNDPDANYCDNCGCQLPGDMVDEASEVDQNMSGKSFKSGRSLSAKNETDLKTAVALVSGVLSSVGNADDSEKAAEGAKSSVSGGSSDNANDGVEANGKAHQLTALLKLKTQVLANQID